MDLPETSFTSCPIDFLYSAAGLPWAAWVFVAWIALMVTVGLIGAILVKHELRRHQTAWGRGAMAAHDPIPVKQAEVHRLVSE